MSRPTDSTFRKIDLQSSADLAFLAQKLLERVDARVNEALPVTTTTTTTTTTSRNGADSDSTSGPEAAASAAAAATSQDDPVRAQVRKLMHEWVAQVYKLAGSSLAINGEDVTEKDVSAVIGDDGVLRQERIVEEFEPIDAKLAMHLRKLEAQKDSLNEKVADLRRLAPIVARDRWLREQNAPDGLIQSVLSPLPDLSVPNTTDANSFPPPPPSSLSVPHDSSDPFSSLSGSASANANTTHRSTDGETTKEGRLQQHSHGVSLLSDPQFRQALGVDPDFLMASLDRARESWVSTTDTLVGLEKRLAEDLARAKKAEEVADMIQARSAGTKKAGD